MIRDHHTRTPDQAAAFDRSQAYRDDTDWDPRDDLEPREVVADDHECPGEDCQRMLCVAERIFDRRRDEAMFARTRAEIDEANRREWDSA